MGNLIEISQRSLKVVGLDFSEFYAWIGMSVLFSMFLMGNLTKVIQERLNIF